MSRPVSSSDDIFPRLRGDSLFPLPEEGGVLPFLFFFLELDGGGVERFLRRSGLRRPGESPPRSGSAPVLLERLEGLLATAGPSSE